MNRKKEIKRTAKIFLRKMGGHTTFSDIRYYLDRIGWKVYLFNGSDDKGDTLIETLKLQVFANNKRSFLATREGHRFIFIRSRMPENEAIYYLLHEVGHIMLGHLDYRDNIIIDTVEKEEEANLFARYALTHTPGKNRTRRRTIIAAVVILLFIAYYQTDKQKQRTPAYFVEGGTSYHRQVCTYTAGNDRITETTIKDAEQLGLQPCPVCQPKPE